MKVFTPAVEDQVTRDWAANLTSLGIYRPLHLLRVVGPLVEGVLLDKDSSNRSYLPTFHLHFLTNPFPAISLAVKEVLKTEKTNAPDRISVDKHRELFADAFRRFKKRAVILPVDGDLVIDDVIKVCWQNATSNPNFYRPDLLENIILLNVWASRFSEANEVFQKASVIVSQWPQNVLASIGGVESWRDSISEKLHSPELVRATVSEQVKFHRLEDIPFAKLLG